MDDDLLERVRATGLLPRDAPVVVLLSGGRDSVCLLDVTARLAGPAAVHALHVDYGLRGPDSEADARHCAALCARLGADLAVERARRPPGTGGSIQAWARDVRYAAAARAALRWGAAVAVGHTATDQAETVLYRLASSPGRRALLGMDARDGRLVRPLLGATREQTAAHCRARGLDWREDATNVTAAYARGRVRGRLTPALRAVDPRAEANVVRTAEILREEAAVLDELVAEAVAPCGRLDGIELTRLRQLAPALRRLVVRRLAEDAAGRPVPGVGGRVEALLALGARGGSAELHVGAGMRAIVEYGVLRFGPLGPDNGGGAAPSMATLAVPGRARFGAYELWCEAGPAGPAVPVGDGGPPTDVLDADALAPELVVRGWRAGDRMAPLGLGGRRSVQDLFTDRRIPRARRSALPIVESAGEIAWIPGVAISHRFRITAGTTRTVRLRARLVAERGAET